MTRELSFRLRLGPRRLFARLTGLAPVAIGAIFLAASWAKAYSPSDVIAGVESYLKAVGLGATSAMPRIAVGVLVVVEVLLGAWLVSGLRSRAALGAGAALLLLMSAWFIHAHALTGTTRCGCGVPRWLGDGVAGVVIRNLVLASLCLVAAWRLPSSQHSSTDSIGSRIS